VHADWDTFEPGVDAIGVDAIGVDRIIVAIQRV
jgi:hypothetical protein